MLSLTQAWVVLQHTTTVNQVMMLDWHKRFKLKFLIHLVSMVTVAFKKATCYVLRHTNMPAILVELGFISNPNEERALQSPQTQEDFANRIANGIASYFGG